MYSTCVELLPFPSCTKSPTEIRKKSCYWRYGSKTTDPVTARLNLLLKTLGCSGSLTSISQEISLLTSSKHRHGRVTGGSLRAPTSPAEAGAPSEKLNRGRQEYWPIFPGCGKFWHREVFASNWAKQSKRGFQDKQWGKYFSVSKSSHHLNICEGNRGTENPQSLWHSQDFQHLQGGAATAKAGPAAQNPATEI